MKHSCFTGKPKGKQGFKPTGTYIPTSRGIKCLNCSRPTRTEKLYCKKCRWEIHYSRQVDAWGNRLIELEDFVNDSFYD